VLVIHLGLNTAPSTSKERREFRFKATLFTGLAQLLPKSTIVNAFEKKEIKMVNGERCFVIIVCPYRNRTYTIPTTDANTRDPNPRKANRRTVGEAHFLHFPFSQKDFEAQHSHPSHCTRFVDDLSITVEIH